MAALVFGLFIVFVLSCTSPFSPSTDLGKQVLDSVDSSLTALTAGFKSVSGLNIPIVSAKSIVLGGADTSTFVVKSGDHPLTFLAGSLGDDSAFGYAELHASTSILTSLRTEANGIADSINLLLYYDSTNNDWQYGNTNTIQVFLCSRKCFPLVRNDLTVTQNFLPCTTITFNRAVAHDTFNISLGLGMISLLRTEASDSTTRVKYIAEIDTVYTADTAVRTVGLFTGIDSVVVLKPAIYGDTAIFAVMAEHFSTPPPVTSFTWDTLFPVNRVDAVQAARNGDSAVITYYTSRYARFDTTFVHDSTEKFIGAVSVQASGGGLVRFSGKPAFQIFYRAHPTDLTPQNTIVLSPYYDICVSEKKPLPADSLVASWQADRFIELTMDLRPLWDSMGTAGNGKIFRIVQNVTFPLNATDPLWERVGVDTTRTVVYGLFDHQITGSRANNLGTRDSLSSVMTTGINEGWLKSAFITVNPTPTELSLQLAVFLQGLYNTGKPSTGYLYLFVKPDVHFSRLILENKKAATCDVVFSNPQWQRTQ